MAEKIILVVEDNPDDEEFTLRALKRANVTNRIVVVRDGAEAVDYLFGTGAFAGRDPNDRPAVVLLDLKLPKLGGIEVLQRMRDDESLKRVPVVMLTSSSEESDLARSWDLGVNAYVVKPVDVDQFFTAVKTLGQFWAVFNEAPAE